MAGALEAKVRSVVNSITGYGYTAGTVVIRDQATGRVKLLGAVVGVLEPDGGTEGILSGRTTGPASVRLFANFNVQQDQRPAQSSASWARTARLGSSRIRRCSRTPAGATTTSQPL